MSAANKAKGTSFETAIVDYLQGQGVRAKRLPRTGVKDIGDVAFPIGSDWFREAATIVVEAKNRRGMDLPTWIAEAEAEAANYNEKYPAEGPVFPIVVHKRRGKGTHLSYVTLPLDGLVELLRELGAV